MIEEFVKHISVILTEMCKRVDVDYKAIDFNKKSWFWKHSWRQEEQDSFVEWLAEYLRNNKDARNVIMKHPSKKKKETVETARSFVWNYGWKISLKWRKK